MAEATSSTSSARPTIVLFGDSLTEYSFDRLHNKGFGQIVTEYFKDKAEVINEGHAGFTTESIKPAFTLLRNRLTRSNSKPLFITIWLGANDATLSFANVPLDKFISNLRTFVTSLLDHPIVKEYGTKIILMTPPPIDVPPPPNPNEPIEKAKTRVGYMTWINKMKYADAVLTLEEEFVQARLEDQVGCVDIWRALINFGLQNEGREKIEPHVQLTEELVLGKRPTGCGLPGTKKFPDRVFIDGLHFDELGYEVVNSAFFDYMENKWPDILSGILAEK